MQQQAIQSKEPESGARPNTAGGMRWGTWETKCRSATTSDRRPRALTANTWMHHWHALHCFHFIAACPLSVARAERLTIRFRSRSDLESIIPSGQRILLACMCRSVKRGSIALPASALRVFTDHGDSSSGSKSKNGTLAAVETLLNAQLSASMWPFSSFLENSPAPDATVQSGILYHQRSRFADRLVHVQD